MKTSGKSLFMQTVYLTVALAVLPLAGISGVLFVANGQLEKEMRQADHAETLLIGAHNLEQLFSQAFVSLYAARLRDTYPNERAPAGKNASKTHDSGDEPPGEALSAEDAALPVHKFASADARRIFGEQALADSRGMRAQPGLPDPASQRGQDIRFRPHAGASLPSPSVPARVATPPLTALPPDAVYTFLSAANDDSPTYAIGIACERVRQSLALASLSKGTSLRLIAHGGQNLCPAAGSEEAPPEAFADEPDTPQPKRFTNVAQMHVPGVDTSGIMLALVHSTDTPGISRDIGIFLVLLVWAAVAFAAFCLLRYRLGRPMAHLVRSALDLAASSYTSRVRGPISVVEFKRLAGSLNSLARQVDVTGRSLFCAERDLKDDSEYTTDLFANMSHEFRTPLNTIIGMAYLSLRSDDLDPAQKSYVSRIHQLSTQLQQTINGILELSRLDRSATGTSNSEFALRDIFEEQHRRFFSKAKAKDLSLEYALDENVPDELAGDPVRLGHIVGALIDNAVRYTDRGGVFVRGGVEERQLYKAMLCITVQDTGPGMSRGQQALYRRIFMGDTPLPLPAVQGKGGRAGIMLAHRLALLMNGRLALENTPDPGTCISLRVPVGVRAQNTTRAQGKVLENIRILAIDDDPLSLSILDEILHTYGAQVTTELSPEKGLALIRSADQAGAPFHVLLLDWRMPGLDGATLAKRVRRDERLARMPSIIMLSSYGWEGIPVQAQQSGADAFLHKPVAEKLLLEALASLISIDRENPSGSQQVDNGPDTGELEGMQVLVVEDNMLNQEIVRELLNEIGVKTQYAEDGGKALDIFEANPAHTGIDLVLMDLQMPEMDGFEATRRIRRLTAPFAPDLPIIAMTAFARDMVAEAAKASGMDDYVSKPFDTHIFFNTLLRWRPVRPTRAATRYKELARLLLACKRAEKDVSERYEDLRDFLLSHVHEGRVAKLDALVDSGKYSEAGAFLERVIDVLFAGDLPREKTGTPHTTQRSDK
ncbi:response regulator [Desulfovibrio sp. OttesenSCG-928-G15]|nr:response regulator [Desulfovibrio sp. OttesenSCG-928-G15]